MPPRQVHPNNIVRSRVPLPTHTPGAERIAAYQDPITADRENFAHSLGVDGGVLPGMEVPDAPPHRTEPIAMRHRVADSEVYIPADNMLGDYRDRLGRLPEEVVAVEGLQGRARRRHERQLRRYARNRAAAAIGVRRFATVLAMTVPHGNSNLSKNYLNTRPPAVTTQARLPSIPTRVEQLRQEGFHSLAGMLERQPLLPDTSWQRDLEHQITETHRHRVEGVKALYTHNKYGSGAQRPESAAWPPQDPAIIRDYDGTYATARDVPRYGALRRSHRRQESIAHRAEEHVHHGNHRLVEIAEGRDRIGRRNVRRTERNFRRAERLHGEIEATRLQQEEADQV